MCVCAYIVQSYVCVHIHICICDQEKRVLHPLTMPGTHPHNDRNDDTKIGLPTIGMPLRAQNPA